jgi:hypothetical protein
MGAPYIYDISHLRVNSHKTNQVDVARSKDEFKHCPTYTAGA